MIRRSTLALAAALASNILVGCDARPKASAKAADIATAVGAADSGAQLERGRYLVAIMDCAGCHNKGAFSPQPAAGFLEGATVGHEVPGLGIFYPPNLTPHPEAGLGRWSEDEIVAAIRTGRRPDGRELSPAMPWRSYAALSDDDARAVVRYLKSLPPSANRSPAVATAGTAANPYLTMRAP